MEPMESIDLTVSAGQSAARIVGSAMRNNGLQSQ